MFKATAQTFDKMGKRKAYTESLNHFTTPRGFTIDKVTYEKHVLTAHVQSNGLSTGHEKSYALLDTVEKATRGKFLDIHCDKHNIIEHVYITMPRSPPGW